MFVARPLVRRQTIAGKLFWSYSKTLSDPQGPDMPGRSAGPIKTENQIDLRATPRHPPQVDGAGNHIAIGEGADVDSRIVITGDGNRLIIGENSRVAGFTPVGAGAALADPKQAGAAGLTIQGSGNTVEIAPDCRLGATLTVIGDNNHFRLGHGCTINGFVNLLSPTGSTLSIGAGTTMVQVSIQLHEPGEITFGEDCMVSSQVYVSLSDIHPIYDRATGQRINAAASITIGNHVWLGLRSMIMKGATIGDGAVVAAGAILSGPAPANTVMAGVPARVARENIVWRRELSESPPEPTITAQSPHRGWWLFGRRQG
jgi:carbonic anhydrase/acetyltransferase-like protein (isoleucine patch superfamily)